MKRSKSVSLALISTIPFALSACDSGEKVKTVTSSKTFTTFQECVDDKIPAEICSNSMVMALNEHRKNAPSYSTEAACEADFMKDYCQVSGVDGQWMPKLGGFQITESHDVKYRKDESGQFVPVQTVGASTGSTSSDTVQTTGGGGGTTIINNNTGGGHSGGSMDFVTGMLVGNALSGGGNNYHYHSEPVYKSRDSRGDYSDSTLKQRIDSGSTFKESNQAKAGYDYKQQSITSSLANRTSPSNSSNSNNYGSNTYPKPSTTYNSGSSYKQSSGSGYYDSGSSYKTSSNNYGTSANSASISRGGFGNQAAAKSSWGGGSSKSFSFGG